MSNFVFEIRFCLSCGLRYPVEKNHAYSMRCPQCLGETQIISQKTIHTEAKMRVKTIKRNKIHRAVLLDNIRSAWNVGSILRSADGLGFDQVFLCGITPTPENEAVKKTSLGAEKTIQWSYAKNAVTVIKSLKAEGWKVYAIEEDSQAVEIQKLKTIVHQSVLIVGSEITGVDSELLSLCDEIFYIPMRGEKRSLNVAIAFSIAGFVLGVQD